MLGQIYISYEMMKASDIKNALQFKSRHKEQRPSNEAL